VGRATRTAAWLTPAIASLARAQNSVTAVQRIAAPDGTVFAVAVLPSANSRALLPNRQRVDDLIVPFGGSRQIRLTRSYNSFFDPAGEFGQGWTLDLPRWTMTPFPVKRDGTHAEYRLVPHVRSPLGTMDIRFAPSETTGGIRAWVSPEHPEVIGVAKGRSDLVGGETNRVLFRDGTTWHFDDSGRLVLMAADGTGTRYVWGPGDRLVQIVGYLGTEAVAEIRLTHGQSGRIVEAVAAQAAPLGQQARILVSTARFEYGDDGRLLRVRHPSTAEGGSLPVRWAYTYDGHRLKTIGGHDHAVESFEYDEQGRVLWAQQGDQRTQYVVTTTAQGTLLRKETRGQAGKVETWTFDGGLRQLGVDSGSGEVIRWRYGTGREMSETRIQDGRPVRTRTISDDGRTEKMVVTDGPTCELHRDASGRPTAILVDGAPAARITWSAEGTPVTVRMGDTEVHARRAEDGRTTGVLISAPMDAGRTTHWHDIQWDVMGRPTTMSDSTGFNYRVQYDARGRVQTVGRVIDGGALVGAQIDYDDANRITHVQSSWGTETRAYSVTGVLTQVQADVRGARSTTTYDPQGRRSAHVAFDGGVTRWRYQDGAPGTTPLTIDLPNGERLSHAKQSVNDRSHGEIALGSARVLTESDSHGRVTALTWQGRR
jgi:YD repeat-containing protein